MRRREFIAGLGSATAWPMVARAQGERVRRLGVASGFTEADGVGQAYVAALKEGLAKLGWLEGRNLRVDIRWGGADPTLAHTYAAELVSLAPDVIVTVGGTMTRAVKQQTKTIPIVFALVGDPSTNSIVANIARPEGNLTGITNIYNTIAGKWLELLNEAAPSLKRVGLIYNPGLATDSAGFAYFPSIEEASRV
jgi:putative tryptophan/tyrosine transport system substrate-binding protein